MPCGWLTMRGSGTRASAQELMKPAKAAAAKDTE